MIERRRLFFRGDLLLDISISPFLQSLFNLHAYSKAQLALWSSLKWSLSHQPMPKKLIDDVEDLLCATGQGQIETRFSVFAQSSDLRLGYGILPAGAQWLGKYGLFCRRLFSVHRGSFSTVPLQLIFATA
jgi:hypothetical protein